MSDSTTEEFEFRVHLRGDEGRGVRVIATTMSVEDGALIFRHGSILNGVFPLAGVAYAGRKRDDDEPPADRRRLDR